MVWVRGCYVGRSTVLAVSAMVRLGARVSIAPDRAPGAYGAPLIRVYDAAGGEVRTEVRGRELEVLDIVLFVELDGGERVATAVGENRLVARLGELRRRQGDLAPVVPADLRQRPGRVAADRSRSRREHQ
jgi:hypothetical protein